MQCGETNRQGGTDLRPTTAIRNFLQLEAAGGILLIAAAALAMLVANSPLDRHYNDLLDVYAEVSIGELGIRKPVLLWINDGLMAIFFLLIGLEVKREIRDGQLSNPRQVVLPGIAALFGLAMPALIYVAFNWGDSEALNGWAIPAATDIAFALGILYLVGSRVPTALKLFLLTVAIFDDLAAIVIIAVFYTADLSLSSLVLAGVTLVVLLIMNLSGVQRTGIYLFVGVLLWVFVLKSGVHATLAGVALAFAIPLKGSTAADHSPLRELEHTLHPWVAYGILPLFAFANAGISLSGISLDTLTEPIPLGIALGLFVGKPVGIFGASWIAIRLGVARLPEGVRWVELFGVAVLGGVGFTMSLFIASLAFEHGVEGQLALDRLGIITGSLLAALCGFSLLRYAVSGRPVPSDADSRVSEPTDSEA